MGKYIILFVNILLAVIVAAIGGLMGLFWGISLGHYLGIFFGLIALQLFIGWMYTYYIDSKMQVVLDDIKSRNALTESIQFTELTCAYCSTKNNAEIILNKENYFVCDACKQNNHVSLVVATERTTKPMEKENIVEIFRKLDKPNG